ncbi:hypothetical protein [Ahrensia sp. 13_GOM-1096m]|uniref:hypothetical protein n=1 Tax=Ahrensia sp. 13_GOM-1096m TaxID=1380380 RepID=UPI0004792538|nr:hypothetical protein [Ahrensia sp. 13_GOM-1096m]
MEVVLNHVAAAHKAAAVRADAQQTMHPWPVRIAVEYVRNHKHVIRKRVPLLVEVRWLAVIVGIMEDPPAMQTQ